LAEDKKDWPDLRENNEEEKWKRGNEKTIWQ
jgi:hypothetical protein